MGPKGGPKVCRPIHYVKKYNQKRRLANSRLDTTASDPRGTTRRCGAGKREPVRRRAKEEALGWAAQANEGQIESKPEQ